MQAVAESIVVREEALSERAFDPVFRVKARELLAALPLAELVAQTGDDGLGLNALGDTQADLVYTPVTPCRIIDTRLGGGIMAANTTRDFLVTGTDYSAQGGSATGCGVPYGPATAAVINFVAVTPTGQGSLWVTPYGTPMPVASTINYTTGVNIANGVTVAICNPSAATCTRDITIRAHNSATHVAGDVQGYFQRVATGGVGTALLADSAVTAPKISSGVVVRSLNSQTDAVTLAGTNGLSVTQGSGTVTVTSNATAANTASTIVARDSSGNFSAGTVTLAGNLSLPNTTSASVGVVTKGGTPFLHNFGTYSTFVGSGAGNLTLTGSANSALGNQALNADTTGGGNAAFGNRALYVNTTGNYNSAFGSSTLSANTTGNYNVAVGYGALSSHTDAWGNSAVGFSALFSNLSGAVNSAFGYGALHHTTGGSNSAFGYTALYQNTTGIRNAALGQSAGYNLTSGNDNVYIANSGVATESGAIHVGTVGTHTATYIAGIHGQTSADGIAVYVNSSGQLGTATSSRRYKEQIADMEGDSDVLLKLRPVSFYYRPELDETHLRQYGLVAEEVAEVAPGLVEYDKDGAPYTVRYHLVNAMLLNEVQKQRRQIDELKEQLARLEARLPH